jgi:hypothetical protein
LTVNRVVRELCNIAFANMEDYVNLSESGPDGRTADAHVDFSNVSRDQWAAVESIEIEMDPRQQYTVRKRKIKLHSKLEAIKMLVNYTGMSNPDNPYWRADAPKPVIAALPDGVTIDNAADAYGRMING